MAVREHITLLTLQARKRSRQKISMLTCYDHAHAVIQEHAGIDCILVGDSASQVILGYPSTLPVRMDFMVEIAAAVRRGAPSVFLIGDMPYLSFTVSPQEAIRNAGRFMAEAGCDAVKLEGDGRLVPTVEALSAAMIPVVVHLGLRPQAVHLSGGYRAQARDADSALRLIEDAKRLERAGACMLLLEAVPPEPARIITDTSNVPVIGCGAGPDCDGHVVVLHDMLGLSFGPSPRFVKRYGDVRSEVARAVSQYISDIRGGIYPAAEHSYTMEPGEAEKLAARTGG